MIHRTAQSGQVGLVIILVMVVVSTIGLSVAGRSTQEVTTTRQSQEAAKTFAAAESAIERVLSDSADTSFSFAGDEYNVSFNDLAETTQVDVGIQKQYSFEERVKEGVTVEVDVANSLAGNILQIQWSSSRVCTDNPASLLIQLVNGVGSAATSRYVTVAPCNHGDNFDSINPNDSNFWGTEYSLKYNLPLQANDTLVRIIPVYADTPLSVAAYGSWTLSPQQFTITSVGKNQAEGGRETKAVQVERSRPFAPGILDFAMVSGTTIVK